MQRMEQLELEPAAVAAAAGISPSTLYRIMGTGSSATGEPRLQTKRRIARALQTTIVWLFNEEQLELPDAIGNQDVLGRLVAYQVDQLEPRTRNDSLRAAAYVLVDLVVSVGESAEPWIPYPDGAGNVGDGMLLLNLLSHLPPTMRAYGAKAAIRAMLKVETANSRRPSEEMYRAVTRTNWSEARILRDHPPLVGATRASRIRSRRADP